MRLLLSSKTVILAFLGSGIVTGFFSARNTVNAQTRLSSVPEINWDTRLSSFELDSQNEGQVFTFICPVAPSTEIYTPVWGTDTYTVNSGLCKAAVHAAMITREGGSINVKLTAKESVYHHSDRYGDKSQGYEREITSMRFLGNPIAIDFREESEREETRTKPRRRPSSIERTIKNGVRRGIERTISDSIRDIFR